MISASLKTLWSALLTCSGQRQEQQQAALKKTGGTLLLLYTLLRRFTQATFKLIRWLRVHWYRPTPLAQTLLHLRCLYAKL